MTSPKARRGDRMAEKAHGRIDKLESKIDALAEAVTEGMEIQGNIQDAVISNQKAIIEFHKDVADAPEGLTRHPQEMSDKVLEARLDDLYVEALDRDIQATTIEEGE